MGGCAADRAHPSGLRSTGVVCERDLHQPHPRDDRRRKRRAFGIFIPPYGATGIPSSVSLGAKLDSLLGQPLDATFGDVGLLAE